MDGRTTAAAAAKAAGMKKGNRLRPRTPTTTSAEQQSRGRTALGTVAEPGAGVLRTGEKTAGKAGDRPQQRDARGRFMSETTNESRAAIRLAKMKMKMTRMKNEVGKLEAELKQESPEWTKTAKTKEMRALWRLAKDYSWLAGMVLKVRRKIEEGTQSQRRWARRELPRYEERKREAAEAKKALGEMHTVSAKEKKGEEEETQKKNKDAQVKKLEEQVRGGAVTVAQLTENKNKTQAELENALRMATATRIEKTMAICIGQWRAWRQCAVLRKVARKERRKKEKARIALEQATDEWSRLQDELLQLEMEKAMSARGKRGTGRRPDEKGRRGRQKES